MADKNIVYFDLETQKCADDVGGWGNIRDMKLSIGVTYSTARGGYKVYGEDQINELIKELSRADLLVGFNNIRFDNEVLAGYTPYDFTMVPTLDMLVYLKDKLKHRLSLDAVAAASLGVQKTSEGLQAVEWFRQGKMIEIAEYCCFDVKITKMVHEYGARYKQLFYRDRFGAAMSVEVDW